MNTSRTQEVVDFLHQLKEEPDVSKRFKEKTDHIITLLDTHSELSIEKALAALEELNGSDLSSYHRTQVWDVISMLESSKTN